VGSYLEMIAITCDGKTAYVMNDASNTVTPVTIATGKAGSAINVGADPDAIVIMPCRLAEGHRQPCERATVG
jgi:hyaluronoglucosaminidase